MGNLRLSIRTRGEVGAYKMWSAVVILSSTSVMDKEEALEESSHPQDSGIWETVATWHPPSSQYAHFQPSAYTIPYPFSPRPVPAPNSSSRLALPGLTPASPVQKPPPSQSSMPPRSQPFPTGRSQKALIATGKAVVVVDWICGSSGSVIDDIRHRRSPAFDITGIDEPSVRSKVAAASDSGSETPVE
ncbi:hypothetical protein BU17DRAFT_71725 [Hysterangium stoloniferum]|nr:hypothetical protein BU17DRAFT_71725 [Hysterangium stoloniferum]